MKSRAVVFRQANQPTLEEVDVPELQAKEVLVRTHYSGVSIGTEQSIFSGQRTHNGSFPVVTGYMTSGVVETVGADVQGITPGDRVVTGGARLDGQVRSVWGAHMSLRVVQAANVHLLPPKLRMADAAMWVMPRVGLNAVNMLNPKAQDTIVIQGQGLIGQFFGQFARHRGCRLIAIEPDPRRAELTRQYVTPDVINPSANDLTKAIEKLTDGKGPDVVVEATGIKNLIGQATALLRPHSCMVFLGWYPQSIELDYAHFHNNSATALFPMGSGGPEVVHETLQSLGSGAIQVGDNLTDIVPWEQACDGFGRIIAGDRSIVAMAIDWSGA